MQSSFSKEVDKKFVGPQKPAETAPFDEFHKISLNSTFKPAVPGWQFSKGEVFSIDPQTSHLQAVRARVSAPEFHCVNEMLKTRDLIRNFDPKIVRSIVREIRETKNVTLVGEGSSYRAPTGIALSRISQLPPSKFNFTAFGGRDAEGMDLRAGR